VDLPFNSSPRTTVGIEVELALVDRADRGLSSAATGLLDVLGRHHPEGEHPRAKHELFECTVEVITGICDTIAEAGADLRATIGELASAAGDRGLGLLSAGTHPFSRWQDQTVSPDPRYAQLLERIGWPARRLAIHGTHVHVGVHSGEVAVAVTNAAAQHLPVFLALSASSPYWQGRDTGLASARTKVFEGLPTAGLPPRLDCWDDFERFMGTLITADAITSVREVWWDVRPHPDFGTVELRMCDALATMREVLAVAALAQCLVTYLQDRVEAGDPPPLVREWVVRENKWLAARHGLDAEVIVDDEGHRRAVRDVTADLVTLLGPVADRLGCRQELDDVHAIVERGASEARQRRLAAAGGTLVDVVDLLLAEFEAGEPVG
jgi:carboxylate-amine ligase